jgi:hypothetical protein
VTKDGRACALFTGDADCPMLAVIAFRLPRSSSIRCLEGHSA